MSKVVINRYVDFINLYSNLDGNREAVFDEHLVNIDDDLQDFRISFHIPTKLETSILEAIKNKNIRLIILTGNAGDGKTYFCRKIIKNLSEDIEINWDKISFDDKIPVANDLELRVIKDLSEISIEFTLKIFEEIFSEINNDTNQIYLIAANEGLLTNSLELLVESSDLDKETIDQYRRMRHLIFDKLSRPPQISNDDKSLILNLNSVTTSVFVPVILDLWTQEDKWAICQKCQKKQTCNILFNSRHLNDPVVANQLTKQISLIESTKIHLTIRDILMHFSFVLTGGLSCNDVYEKSRDFDFLLSRIYSENLWDSQKLLSPQLLVSKHIQQFDPSKGDNVNLNSILAMQGEFLNESWETIFDVSIYDFSYKPFEYLERSQREFIAQETENDENWLENRQYFMKRFLYTKNEFGTKLVPYQFTDEFFKCIDSQDNQSINQIKKNLVAGLSKYFTNYLTTQTHKLQLTTSTNEFSRPLPLLLEEIDLDNIEIFVESTENELIDREPRILSFVLQPIIRNPTKDYSTERKLIASAESTLKFDISFYLFEFLMLVNEGWVPNILEDICVEAINELRDEIKGAFAKLRSKENWFIKDQLEFLHLKDGEIETKRLNISSSGGIVIE